MLKTCLNCGVEFDGSAQARFHSDACRKAYSRREVGQPAPDPAPELGHTAVAEETRTELPTPAEEQAIRDVYGYAKSETRTQAERQAVAERITGKKTSLPSLEEYVRTVRLEAANYADSIGETDAPFEVLGTTLVNRKTERLARAEKYARWRYAGYLTGEVASL